MEYLTLTFIAPGQDVIIDQLIAFSAKHNCRIQESRVSFLGIDFVGFIWIAGNWKDIAKLEKALSTLTIENVSLTVKRGGAQGPAADAPPNLPYLVQVVGLDTANLVNEVVYFFSVQHIQIIDLQTDPFQTNHSNANMLSISMRLNVPADISISDLRERFMGLCDELNVDGMIEPEKR